MTSKLSVLAVLAITAVAMATPSINVGTIYLANDQASQSRTISVTGGDAVQGLELNMKIADGSSGPTFNSVDILSGTVFAANNSGLFPGSYAFARTAYQGVVTNDSTVSANGLLATISFNGTGTANGTYGLSLINTPEGRTNFAGLFTNITDGQIVVTYGGDANGSFAVDVVDLGLLATSWKQAGDWTNGDFNGDKFVDVVDLGILATNWKKGVSGAPLPEPATLSLLALAVPAIFRRRK